MPVSTRQNDGSGRRAAPDAVTMKTLDEVDRKLIALLQDNARLSTVALAKAVGLSRSTVQERLQRLESAGVIAQYTVRLGSGADPLCAWLMLRYAEGFSCDDIVPLLVQWPQVRLAHSVAGETDLMVLLETRSPSELADLRERVAAMNGVDDVTTIPILRSVLDRL